MFPLGLLATLALGGIAGYQYSKKKHKSQNTVSAASGSDVSLDDNNSRSTAQNVYNYNYLNESNTGNTLFGSKQKTRRTLFGNNVKG